MRICLVGDFSKDLDEGYKNISYHFAKHLSAKDDVTCLDIKSYKSVNFWKVLKNCNPQIVQIISQPTHVSLLFGGIIRKRWPNAKIILSSLRPDKYFVSDKLSALQKGLLKFASPDLVLVQSANAETLFLKTGLQTKRLPNGVDLEQFRPVDKETRIRLRKFYNIDPERPVVLHVGHLIPERNLAILKNLPQAGIQVVVAGSLYMGLYQELINDFEKAGFKIFKGYQQNVHELYQLSDIYVFPLIPGISIAQPLSVLEAMATNLNIVTSRFEGLVGSFPEGNGLVYFDPQRENLLPIVEQICNSKSAPLTRKNVKDHSWETITQKLREFYQELLSK